MGIPLVRTEDLLVRNREVLLKTIEGLQPVDVIFRRVSSPDLDPVSIPNLTGLGVPGLLHCVRAGTVRILNAPGSSVLNSRSLLPSLIARIPRRRRPIKDC